MPWVFNGTTAPTAVASGDLTFTEPAGAEEGDLFVVNISFRSTAAFTLPTDWQLVASQLTGGNTTVNTTGSIGSALQAYIVRGASAPALTFTRTGGDVAIGRLVSYRGNKIAGVHDTGVAETLAAASTTVTAASLTTAQIEELLVAGGAMARNTTASAFDAATQPATASGGTDTATAPTSNTWIERGDAGTTTGADAALAVADAIKATAAATGTLQYTAAASARHSLVVGAYSKETQYPDFRSSSGIASSGINTVDVVNENAMPSGWQPGDVFVMVMVTPSGSAGQPNNATGWSQIGANVSIATLGNVSCYQRTAQAGDTAANVESYFANISGDGEEATSTVLCFKDTSGIEGAGSAADTSVNTTATGRAVTTSGDYRTAVNIFAAGMIGGTDPAFSAGPSGWASVYQNGGASTDVLAVVRPKLRAGTITAPSATNGVSTNSAAFSFALKPRVTAPPPFRNPMQHMLVR